MLQTTSEEGKRQTICNVSDAGHLVMTRAPLQSCYLVKKAQFIKEEQSDETDTEEEGEICSEREGGAVT